MQISRNNYEAYLLDYMEGTLDKKGREELALFFRKNPDLKTDFDDYDSVSLQPNPHIVFADKKALKKNEIQAVGVISQDNYEEWIVLSLDGELSPSEQNQFNEFVKINPAVQQEIALYENTFLIPDKNIVYQHKEGLKKKVPFYFYKAVLWPAAVAALLIILFGISLLLNNETQTSTDNQPKFAEQVIEEEPVKVADDPGENIIPEEFPDDTPVDQPAKPLAPEDEPQLFAEAEVTEQETNTEHDQTSIADNLLAYNSSVEGLAMITFADQLHPGSVNHAQISNRYEMTEAFEYMILREALQAERDNPQKEKSTFGKVFASLGNQIFGEASSESESLINGIASRGKESFNEFAEGMPVYRESDEAGRTNTYLALNESLKLRISKKNKPEAENSKD